MSVYVGSTAVGQGLETVMAQIAADTLGRKVWQPIASAMLAVAARQTGSTTRAVFIPLTTPASA